MAKGKTKRRTTNPPSQREIRVGETSNPPPSQSEIGGGEPSNNPPPPPPSPPQEETGGGREIVTIDTDLLDCSICTHPLCPPVYQCMNGHVACPSCWSKLQDKCHICTLHVLSRNIALEKVLESVHLSCTNLGCHKSVSYSQMQVHIDTCEYGRSSCPIPGCAHKAFSGEWREHFVRDHRIPGTFYEYGESCTVLFVEEDLYYTFVGPLPGEDLFLLVMEPIVNVGNALCLYYIDRPHRDQNVFPYELQVGNHDKCVKLKSQAVSIKEWKRGEVHGSSLLVPSGFTREIMNVYVLINKGFDVDEYDFF